jgi:hypothetical protein
MVIGEVGKLREASCSIDLDLFFIGDTGALSGS